MKNRESSWASVTPGVTFRLAGRDSRWALGRELPRFCVCLGVGGRLGFEVCSWNGEYGGAVVGYPLARLCTMVVLGW